MNIYRVTEDGEDILIQAETMTQAISLTLGKHLCEMSVYKNPQYTYDEVGERENYHDNILQSCELLGKLKN